MKSYTKTTSATHTAGTVKNMVNYFQSMGTASSSIPATSRLKYINEFTANQNLTHSPFSRKAVNCGDNGNSNNNNNNNSSSSIYSLPSSAGSPLLFANTNKEQQVLAGISERNEEADVIVAGNREQGGGVISKEVKVMETDESTAADTTSAASVKTSTMTLSNETVQKQEYEKLERFVFTENTYEVVNNKSGNEDTFTSIPLNDTTNDEYQSTTATENFKNEYKGLDINLDEILSNIETIKTEIIDDDDGENDFELVSSHNASVGDAAEAKNDDSKEKSTNEDSFCRTFFKRLFCVHRPV